MLYCIQVLIVFFCFAHAWIAKPVLKISVVVQSCRFLQTTTATAGLVSYAIAMAQDHADERIPQLNNINNRDYLVVSAPTATIEEEDFQYFDADLEDTDPEDTLPVTSDLISSGPTLIRVATFSQISEHSHHKEKNEFIRLVQFYFYRYFCS